MDSRKNNTEDFDADFRSLATRRTELLEGGYSLECTIGDNEAGKAFVENEKSRLAGNELIVLTVRGLIYLLAKKATR